MTFNHDFRAARFVLMITAVATTACYGSAPPKPTTVPLPEVRPGAFITTHSTAKTQIETIHKQARTCPQGKGASDPSCTTTEYSAREPVTRTHTTASYGGVNLNLAQFAVLTDPDYDKKLVRLEGHSAACKRATVPRWVAGAMLLGGIAASAWLPDGLNRVGAAAGFGGAAASYTMGYWVFGGIRCNQAWPIYKEIGLKEEIKRDVAIGEGKAAAMKERAREYNRSQKQRHGQSSPR